MSAADPPAGPSGRQALPERLGKYPIVGVLGKGAMGIVYKAFDPVIRRPMAIKTIRKELLSDSEQAESFAARFRNEVQAAGRLMHPGIVAIYEYGEDDALAYIAMEFVEGNSLRQYFAQKTRFAIADAVSIAAQLLDALQYAHERGVWHRDVKPANVTIMSDGRLKILDFGIARIESSTLTQVGALLGTPGYMAPELYLGNPVDHRADLFAAGVILYQLLAGVAPFTGARDAVMYKVCNEMPEMPSRLSGRPELERFDPVVERALAKNSDDRFVSADSFRRALLDAYDGPVNPTVSEQTIIRGVLRSPYGVDTSQPAAGRVAQSGAASAGMRAARPATRGGPGEPSAPLPAPPAPVPASPHDPPAARTATAAAPPVAQPPGPAGGAGGFRNTQTRPPGADDFRLPPLPAAPPPREFHDPQSRAPAPGEARSAHGSAAGDFQDSRMRAAAAAGFQNSQMPGAGDFQDSRMPTVDLADAGWDVIALGEIERALARHIGPIARVHVRRAARQGADLAAVVASVAAQLHDPSERAAFVAQVAVHAAPAPRDGPGAEDDATLLDVASAGGAAGAAEAPIAPHERLTPQDLERAARLLAPFLGPIAPVLVRRASQGTQRRADFHTHLAAHLTDAAERQRFLSGVAESS